MKLIDILVEELPKNGGWLRDVKTMTQDRGGSIWGYDCFRPCLKGGLWSSKSGDDLVRNSKIEVRNLAVDWNTAIITREQYEAALADKSDGWIELGGGECPVEEGVLVDVSYRDSEYYPDLLGVYALSSLGVGADYWVHDGLCNDIIAYRLHQPTKAEQVRADAWNAYAGITEYDGESDLNERIEHDAAPVWNGEGLPPAGCRCEYLDRNNGWYPVTIKYASNQIVVICGMTNILGDKQETEIAKDVQLDKPQFRQLLTESERKRKEAIEEMFKIATIHTTKSMGLDLVLNSIYNAIAAGEITGVKLED